MVLHEDSIEETIVSQMKSLFQTVIQISDTKLKPSDVQIMARKQNFKYVLKINQRNLVTSKTVVHVIIRKTIIKFEFKFNFFMNCFSKG
jgi:hypothetical protein